MATTVKELIEALEELLEEAGVEDADIMLAQQPQWPLALTVGSPTFVKGKVWIPEGYHPYNDSPYAPRDAWEGGVIDDEDEDEDEEA
jgi:hypothetical protein